MTYPDLGRPNEPRRRSLISEQHEAPTREQAEELFQRRIEYETSEAIESAKIAGCTCEPAPEVMTVHHRGGLYGEWHAVLYHVEECPLYEGD